MMNLKNYRRPYFLLFIAFCSLSISLIAAYYKANYPNPSGMYNLLEYIANLFSNVTVGVIVLFLILPIISKWKLNEKNK